MVAIRGVYGEILAISSLSLVLIGGEHHCVIIEGLDVNMQTPKAPWTEISMRNAIPKY